MNRRKYNNKKNNERNKGRSKQHYQDNKERLQKLGQD